MLLVVMVDEEVLVVCLSSDERKRFMSAYINHSTETISISVRDQIITAMSHQQVICQSFLTLLDVSAAFDITILLERLSVWFGNTSAALFWVKYYLINRSFYVSIEDTVSSVYHLLYGIPQGSVLGPLLFILHSTPLSTVISNSSVNHQLYAEDISLVILSS
jgi:Reverse transcriptase (RNA-dependent DNA polymerase)